MTTALASATQNTVQTVITGLPLRQSDPLSFAFIIKAMLVTVILLAIAYVVLRWYARRNGVVGMQAERADLRCVATLRLSTKTKVYLLKSDSVDLLVTESATGATVTLLPNQMQPLSGPQVESNQNPS